MGKATGGLVQLSLASFVATVAKLARLSKRYKCLAICHKYLLNL